MQRYVLYNQDVSVASFAVDAGTVTAFVPLRPELLPMQIRAASAEGFTAWVRERAIDLNTFQHRQLMHGLLGTRDKVTIALRTHMFSLSDTFTCFAEDAFVPRKALCAPEAQNEISDFILVGEDTTLRRVGFPTPNASTDGSLPKTWRFEEGAWWLYKLQSEAATRSEYEISCVLRECGWDAAEYAVDPADLSRIRTRNFVGENEFFEPYDSVRYLFADRSDDDAVIAANLASLGPAFLKAWKRILLADALFENTDRHMRNFGVIRSAMTGEVLRLAPNYDNNQAYLANPGGRYSDQMLRLLTASEEVDKNDLRQLVRACEKHPYLREAAEAGKRVLQ